MDDVTRKRIDAFDRCEHWFDDNAAGVNTIGKLKNLTLEFKTKLSTLQNTAGTLVLPPIRQPNAAKTHRRLHRRKRLRIRRRGIGFVEIRQPRRSPTQEKGTANAVKGIVKQFVFDIKGD